MIELLNEDCMDVMARYPDNYFDLAIVDPPYGIGMDWKKSTSRLSPHKDTSYKNEQSPPIEYFNELFRVSKNQIIWGYNYYADKLPITNKLIVWDKLSDFLTSRKSDGELAWTSITKYPLRIYKHSWDGGRKGTETGIKTIHPHQKPLKLYDWLLKNYAEKGQKILDTHLGSGSSAIVAHYFGCDFVGCEIDEDYFKAAKERFNNETRQETLF